MRVLASAEIRNRQNKMPMALVAIRLGVHLTETTGGEGVLKMLDFGLLGPFRVQECHYVKARPMFEQSVSFQVKQRQFRQLGLFLDRDGFDRIPRSVIAAGLDLNKYDAVTVGCDEINLTGSGGPLPRQNPKSLPAQVTGRQPLSAVAKPLC
jgi:hypothetical protein